MYGIDKMQLTGKTYNFHDAIPNVHDADFLQGVLIKVERLALKQHLR